MRATWLPALAVGLALMAAAWWLQHRFPDAQTLPEAWRHFRGERPNVSTPHPQRR